MKKLLTVGLLLTMLSMPSSVNAQRFLERVNNTLERVNQALEQVQETTPASRPTVTPRSNDTRIPPTQQPRDVETQTVRAIETAISTATVASSGFATSDGVKVIREGRGNRRNTSEDIDFFNSGDWIRFEWGVPTGGCPGGVTYQWQQSSDGRTWTNAPGTNTERIYTTPPITNDIYFRRLTTDDCGVTFSTTMVRITLDRTIWATRNVGMPGTFVDNPQDPGMLYQWNRRQPWTLAAGDITGWNHTGAGGTTWYAENDPCPPGWRVPTGREIETLNDRRTGSRTENWNNTGMSGVIFGTEPNMIFLPTNGYRNRDGRLVRGMLWLEAGYWSGSPQPGMRRTFETDGYRGGCPKSRTASF